MKVEHIISRLEAIAQWYSPTALGRPECPRPINIHLTAHDAAEALRRLSADLELSEQQEAPPKTQPVMQMTESERRLRTEWPHWCVYDPGTERMLAITSDGRPVAMQIRNQQFGRGRSCVQPVMLMDEARQEAS